MLRWINIHSKFLIKRFSSLNFRFWFDYLASKLYFFSRYLLKQNSNLLGFVEIEGEETLAASEDEISVDNVGEESSEIYLVNIAESIHLFDSK